MFLVFDDVPDAGLAIDCRLELGSAEGLNVVGAVRMVGRACPGLRGVELSARVGATVRWDCSRCLEPVERGLDAEFSLVLVSEAVEFGAREAEVASEDARLFYAQAGKADLREIAREQLYLNSPQKVVCREGCAGLCATCGANRNRIECTCRTADVDPRLAPLLAWKETPER